MLPAMNSNRAKKQVVHNNSGSISLSIFREYDIRGVVGKTLTEKDAFNIGRAFATLVIRSGKGNVIAVGRDGRISSPDMEKNLIDGLRAAGADVISIGLGPSPMLYFAVHTLKASGGVMVTGSHNPKDHNGFKFMLGGDSLHGDQIRSLAILINNNDLLEGKGGLTKKEIKESYVNTLISAYSGKRDLKIAWDSGNGAAGEIVELICKKLPGKHILLNTKIDGTFPSHHPDPTVPENLKQLVKAVESEKCDVGVAFDGDGDRLGVVDTKGRMITGDQMLVIFAREILQKHPKATIIADIKASKVFIDEVKKLGGNPLVWKAGHSLIKTKMKETGAILAGEMSGHFFIKDNYFGFDDGPYAAVRLLSLLAKSRLSITEIYDSMPVMHNTPEYRIACPEDKKFNVIENIRRRLKSRNANFLDIDGVRVENTNGWWLVRASNTQPAISARCEAVSKQALTQIMEELKSELAQEGLSLDNTVGH